METLTRSVHRSPNKIHVRDTYSILADYVDIVDIAVLGKGLMDLVFGREWPKIPYLDTVWVGNLLHARRVGLARRYRYRDSTGHYVPLSSPWKISGDGHPLRSVDRQG